MAKKKVVRGSKLPMGNWFEAASHLGETKVKATTWELTTVHPQGLMDELILPLGMGPTEEDMKEFLRDSRRLASEIERSGKIRPIMIDEIRPGAPWVEGLHRIQAGMFLGLDEIPAYVRIK